MAKHSMNPSIRDMIKTDGEEETKAFVKQHFNIPDHIEDWEIIDQMAKRIQKERNKEWTDNNPK